MRTLSAVAAWLISFSNLLASAHAQEAARAEQPGDSAGHSFHGEVFDEGPRQAAYLMPGVGKVSFPVTTKSPEAQQFINQGVAQLHGFWYFEAERSFRQAAMLDPECAMAYWGMARANTDNAKRAKQFLAEAVKRKKGLTERETMYLDALEAFSKDGTKKKERGEAYAKALEKILYKFPDDIEAKAFLGLQLWLNRNDGSTITSYLAVDALLQQVLAADPLHPANHYVIHLWDLEKAEKALVSASNCGEGAPGIAHMWHMPGHIYSRLQRYQEAVWQQEASARVDHAHMMRDRVLPDQIHNFAHNNEWLIRDLVFIGRARDAVDLAKNMTELPRHPKYNTLKKGSAYYGRMRLLEVLPKFELWDELIALANTPYLEPTDDFAEQVKRLRALGGAQFRKGATADGEATLKTLEELLAPHKKTETEAVAKAEEKAKDETRKAQEAKAKADAELSRKALAAQPGKVAVAETAPEAQTRAKVADEAAAKAKKDADDKLAKARDEARKPTRDKVDPLEKAIDELRGHQAVARGDHKGALELFKKAGNVDAGYLARLQVLAGQKDDAEKAARNTVNSHKNETLPLATLVEVLWQVGKKDDAKKAFEDLRALSSTIDRDVPPFARLDPIAKELGFGDDWRVPHPMPADFGTRPDIASLGPFRWQPSPAPSTWSLEDSAGKALSLAEYRGKPVVLIFYLGHGCLHCVEQVQKFGKKANDFSAAGISLVGVSTDAPAELTKSVLNFGAPFPFPLVSNNTLDVFKAWRVYDDFEKQPLHAVFLLDSEGRVRWQDISFEPFNDADFVLGEAKRLLGQSAVPTPTRPAAAAAPAGE